MGLTTSTPGCRCFDIVSASLFFMAADVRLRGAVVVALATFVLPFGFVPRVRIQNNDRVERGVTVIREINWAKSRESQNCLHLVSLLK